MNRATIYLHYAGEHGFFSVPLIVQVVSSRRSRGKPSETIRSGAESGNDALELLPVCSDVGVTAIDSERE